MRLDGPWRKLFDVVRPFVERYADVRRPRVLKLDALRDCVEVLTDAYGVPHIYAKNTDDLFFAQGYVTARDRFFQMDYNRHAASGRVCELVGRRDLPWRELTVHLQEKSTFDVDVFVRAFGMRRAAEESLEMYSDEARAALVSYAAGVNAYVSSAPRALEHRLLGAHPEPWTPVDSVLMFKAIGFELNFAWRAVLLGALLQDAGVPNDVARMLWPQFPAGGSTIVHGPEWRRFFKELVSTRQAADSALGFGNAGGVGSNSFAVAGTHTELGEALLANDTHLTLTCPVPWHEVRLLGGEWDLHGFALAGVPGVAIGRTPHITWGLTAGLVQDLDLFVERLHPNDPARYLTPDGWQTLYHHDEVFKIRGEEPVGRRIYESRHGPLLDTLATEPPEGHRLAVQWTGHRPGRDLDSLLGVWRARDFAAFRRAVRDHVCPTYNLTYADKEGHVGYVLAGVIPKRRNGAPLCPLEGWTGEWDWQGVVPFEENPYAVDPKCGFVVTANNRIVPLDYPHELGPLFEPPERFNRISARLAELGKSVTPQHMASIQLDEHSGWGLAAREVLLPLAGGVEALAPTGGSVLRQAAEAWRDWDGRASTDSAGAALAIMTAFNTGRELVRRLAGDDASLGFLEMASFVCEPILRLPELQGRLREMGMDLPAVVKWAFERAVETCRAELGSDVTTWRWGRIHTLTCKHRMHHSSVGPLFSLGPVPASGGPDTVNRGDIDGSNSFRLRTGPAMRMVASAKERDRAGTVVPGGQSGHRFSSHYDDQLPLFLRGELKDARISREDLTLRLREELWPTKGID